MVRRGWILKEGYPFIAPPVLVSVAGFVLGWSWVGWLGLLLAAAVALFFRNPPRRPLQDDRLALAPADGRVVEVRREGENGGLKISIFMSVFNVHVNRSPVRGRVVELRHYPGRFRPAHRAEASEGNERLVMGLAMEDGRRVTCVQVAGILARRIVSWVKEGTVLSMGEPFGMIRFGSRVDCYFPPGFDPDVREGQRVWAGETVIGYFLLKEKPGERPPDRS